MLTHHSWCGLMFVICSSFVSHAVYAECTILLHGLARTHHSMTTLGLALENKGYTVVNISYPSREHSIEVLANDVIPRALTYCPKDLAINVVTHSMGAILLRQYLSSKSIPRLHRVVMLAPPNQGSEVVDKLGAYPGFHWLNGDAGMQLGTSVASLPNRLAGAHFNVGIIAGTRSINIFLSTLIPGQDDGKVSVERTKLVGMSDHIVMPVTHTFMMTNKAVIQQVVDYLKKGQFTRDRTQP